MANTYRVTHSFQGTGGTTKDQYVNSFHFFSSTFAPADAATWGPTLAASTHYLWSTLTDGQSIGNFYHPRCANNLGMTKIYDVTSSELAGTPIYSISDAALLPSANYVEPTADQAGLPEEVAVCLSYEAIHTGGDLPRRRGRIYLGPLNVKAIQGYPTAYNSPTRVADTLIECMLGAAQGMQNSLATYGFEWRVYSKMDGFAFKIVEFSVDDEFDTLRGRGQRATYRGTRPIL